MQVDHFDRQFDVATPTGPSSDNFMDDEFDDDQIMTSTNVTPTPHQAVSDTP